jgi:hypothetical protein
MNRYRHTIALLMAVMIPVALGLVALREGTQFWVDIVFNLVVASLLLATYKAKCSRGTAGAYWTGFAAFGWTNLILGLIGVSWAQHYGVSPNLVTLIIVERVWEYFDFDSDTPAVPIQGPMARFLVVHSILSLLLGLIGAITFGFFARQGEPTSANGMEGTGHHGNAKDS